jgi:hypothetical protein
VSAAIAVCAAACGSGTSPVTVPRGATTQPRTVDQGAIYFGLSVRLQLDSATVENDRAGVRAYFLVENRTKRTISYRGCPFGNIAFGLLPSAHPDGPLTGTAQTSCSGGVVSVNAGRSDRYFAATFITRSPTIRLPAGAYVAVVRFADGTEVRKSMTIAPSGLQVAPASGGPLTVVSIRGEGCVKSSGEPGTLDVIVNLTTTDRQTGLDATHVPVRADGSWIASLTVPATAAPNDYLVNATCNRDGDIVELEYESEPFTVT